MTVRQFSIKLNIQKAFCLSFDVEMSDYNKQTYFEKRREDNTSKQLNVYFVRLQVSRVVICSETQRSRTITKNCQGPP